VRRGECFAGRSSREARCIVHLREGLLGWAPHRLPANTGARGARGQERPHAPRDDGDIRGGRFAFDGEDDAPVAPAAPRHVQCPSWRMAPESLVSRPAAGAPAPRPEAWRQAPKGSPRDQEGDGEQASPPADPQPGHALCPSRSPRLERRAQAFRVRH